MKKVLLSLVLVTSLMSCDYEAAIDCDCGEIVGFSPTTVTIYSDCGGTKTIYDLTSTLVIGGYYCKESTYTPSGPGPGAV